mgnify:CR=1 FL=1
MIVPVVVLGQVKDAYRLAVERKTSGVILNRLIHKTFLVAKRVRSETGIGDSAVSVSYAAVELAKKIGVELTPEGYIREDTRHRTSIPGIYSAGDVEGGYKQIVTAAGQ